MDKNDDYYNQARAFHVDTYAIRTLERNRWFLATLVALLIAVIAVVAVIGLTPLKTVVPYMVQNNSATGEIRVVEKMQAGSFTASDKNVEKHVADYIRYRESFDHHTIREHYRYVQLMSSDKVNAQYIDYMKNSPQSPYKIYTDGEHIDIYITDMNHLNESSVLAHVDTTEYRKSGKPLRKRWAVVLDFEWKGIPLDSEYRYFNPAGFTVTRFRKDQMLIKSGVGN